jgi:hypothetical protein
MLPLAASDRDPPLQPWRLRWRGPLHMPLPQSRSARTRCPAPLLLQVICRQLRQQAERQEAALADPYSAPTYHERAAKVAAKQERDVARAQANQVKLARAAERAAAAAAAAAVCHV